MVKRLLCLLPAVLLAGWLWYGYASQRPYGDGKSINRLAWEASFSERGVKPPLWGPRDGYWGARMSPRVSHGLLGWHDGERNVPLLLEIDSRGRQYYQPATQPKRRLLIMGGSVAFGAYASTIAKTYYVLVGDGLAAEMTIFAAGGWRSQNELPALRSAIAEVKPHQVVLLNGLNDLVNTDGTPHKGDYAARLRMYLANMRAAAKITAAHKAELVIVLQPSLAEKDHLSDIEKAVLNLYADYDLAGLRSAYEVLRQELPKIADVFVDASRAFDQEQHTLFADMWHFADEGHAILADLLVNKLRREQ